jgi:hypothetical protein
VTTTAGDFEGYAVIGACESDGILGVIGAGAQHLPADRTGLDGAITDLRTRTEQALAPLAVGVGYGVGCQAGHLALRVYVRTYRDVDEAIRRLGAFLLAQDLGEEYLLLIVREAVLL